MCGTLITIGGKLWAGIESVSVGVSDFLGVTSPRYEMYIDDSIEYQKNVRLTN